MSPVDMKMLESNYDETRINKSKLSSYGDKCL